MLGQHVEGRCWATWKTEFKLPWRETGPLNYLNDEVDSEQLSMKNSLLGQYPSPASWPSLEV